jgi:hypothetical protein
MRKVILVVLMFFCLFGCTQNPVSVKNGNLSEPLTTVSFNISGGNHLRGSEQDQAPIVSFRLVLFENAAGKNHFFTMEQQVQALNGSATVTFSGVPELPVVGEMRIAGGNLGGSKEFHGATQIISGTRNIIDLAPIGSCKKEDILARYLKKETETSSIIINAESFKKIQDIVEKENLSNPDILTKITDHLTSPPSVEENQTPVCSWDSPGANYVYQVGDHIVFKGHATDVDGEISRIEFYADNQLWNVFEGNSFEFTIKAESASEIEVYFKAFDDRLEEGISNRLTIEINPASNILPVCNWIEPVNHYYGEVESPFILAGAATDEDGIITKIEIYRDNQLWATVASGSFAYKIYPEEPTDSAVYFKAFDNDGGITVSSEQRIIIVEKAVAKPLELILVSNDGNDVFLGTLSTNKFLTTGIFNEFGDYGSPYKSNSIWNNYGPYGSDYSGYSAFNFYGFYPPKIINQHGIHVGYLSKNKFLATTLPVIDPDNLYNMLFELGL